MPPESVRETGALSADRTGGVSDAAKGPRMGRGKTHAIAKARKQRQQTRQRSLQGPLLTARRSSGASAPDARRGSAARARGRGGSGTDWRLRQPAACAMTVAGLEAVREGTRRTMPCGRATLHRAPALAPRRSRKRRGSQEEGEPRRWVGSQARRSRGVEVAGTGPRARKASAGCSTRARRGRKARCRARDGPRPIASALQAGGRLRGEGPAEGCSRRPARGQMRLPRERPSLASRPRPRARCGTRHAPSIPTPCTPRQSPGPTPSPSARAPRHRAPPGWRCAARRLRARG